MRSVFAGLVLGVLLVACSSGEVGAGDCFVEPPRDAEAGDRVDCEEGAYELVAVDELRSLEASRWPGLEEMSARVYDRCVEAVEDYVEGPLAEVDVDVWYAHVDEDAFRRGERGYACAATTFDGSQLGGSVAGVAVS